MNLHPHTFLTVIGPQWREGGSTKIAVRCICGTEKSVFKNTLKKVRSCGCMHDQLSVRTKHGLSATPEYHVWLAMLARCQSPTNAGYKNYGGRGITVCDQWQSVERFIADMGPRPSSTHAIDRKDNDGNYEPANCRWATARENCRNRRSNNVIHYDGVSATLAEWAERTGINASLLGCRLRLGWSIEKTLTQPIRRCHIRRETERVS